MYKDIDKQNKSTVCGVSASVCLGKVKEGETVWGAGQTCREGSRGAETLHQAPQQPRDGHQYWFGLEFFNSSPSWCSSWVSYMFSKTEIPGVPIWGSSEIIFLRSGLQMGGLPFNKPEVDERLWCQQPGVQTTLFLIQKWSSTVIGSRAFPSSPCLRNERAVCSDHHVHTARTINSHGNCLAGPRHLCWWSNTTDSAP